MKQNQRVRNRNPTLKKRQKYDNMALLRIGWLPGMLGRAVKRKAFYDQAERSNL